MNERQYVRKYLLRLKTEHGCSVCHDTHPATLQFHHRPGTDKRFNISAYFQQRQYRFSDLLDELKKCDVLCARCHQILHYHPKEKETIDE